MAALSGLLLGFATFISSFLALVGRKALVAASAITLTVALTVGFVFSIGQIVIVLKNLIDFPPFILSLGWFIPTNFTVLISSILSARICRAAYDLAMTKLRLVTSAN